MRRGRLEDLSFTLLSAFTCGYFSIKMDGRQYERRCVAGIAGRVGVDDYWRYF
jgi:hypothetical protein